MVQYCLQMLIFDLIRITSILMKDEFLKPDFFNIPQHYTKRHHFLKVEIPGQAAKPCLGIM